MLRCTLVPGAPLTCGAALLVLPARTGCVDQQQQGRLCIAFIAVQVWTLVLGELKGPFAVTFISFAADAVG